MSAARCSLGHKAVQKARTAAARLSYMITLQRASMPVVQHKKQVTKLQFSAQRYSSRMCASSWSSSLHPHKHHLVVFAHLHEIKQERLMLHSEHEQAAGKGCLGWPFDQPECRICSRVSLVCSPAVCQTRKMKK